jgi:hypothetical protein
MTGLLLLRLTAAPGDEVQPSLGRSIGACCGNMIRIAGQDQRLGVLDLLEKGAKPRSKVEILLVPDVTALVDVDGLS